MTSHEHRNVFVAGHRGMVGSAIVRQLKKHGYENILTASRQSLDLLDQRAVHEYFKANRTDEIYLAAAKVGGIHANSSYPADFIYENLVIEGNVVHAAWQAGVRKLMFLGSSCIYPKLAEQPMREEALLTGLLEPTNEPYAIAKIAGIKLCQSYNRQYSTDYRSIMPTNLYGPGDNFHAQDSHVIPALLRRFHAATRNREPEVVIWGSGKPRREFLHVDDLAEAAVAVMELDIEAYRSITGQEVSHINVGTGADCTIAALAEYIARVVSYNGRLVFDTNKPDGTPRKLLDITRIRSLGWKPSIGIEEGLRETYQWFLEHQGKFRA